MHEVLEPERLSNNVYGMLVHVVDSPEGETISRRPPSRPNELHTLRDEVRGRLGTYDLLHRLGSGGMGEVFLARPADGDTDQTPVALKRVLPGLSHQEEMRQLFVDEARLTARMAHDGLAPAIDTDFAASDGFFTLPFNEGIPLTTLLRAAARNGQPLPDGAALQVVQSVATALHYAHELLGANRRPLDVVHCDVSPGNVLISRNGTVKLIDWGIARGRHLTRGLPEMARGTLGYSSPEQASGKRVDRRSDVFSVGVMMWELTTMRRLFRGVNRADTALRVANADAPKPSTVRRRYPVDLEEIVMKSLVRDPNERMPSALRLEVAIERYVRRNDVDTSRQTLAGWVAAVTSPEPDAEPDADR